MAKSFSQLQIVNNDYKAIIPHMLQELYASFEHFVPTPLKRLFPERWRVWLGYQIMVARDRGNFYHQLICPLQLPPGQSEQSLLAYLQQFYIEEDGPSEELWRYLDEDFRRFLYTLALVPQQNGRLLEIGANPYFMSLLLHRFTNYELAFTNYFGPGRDANSSQTVLGNEGTTIHFPFAHVNIETEPLPYTDHSFDVVLMCEVIEHFTHDPLRALHEIRRVLKPGGILILTTPNVARLENVARLLSNHNLYDPYSGYGPYGRHNREYTSTELSELLQFMAADSRSATHNQF
jgi:SAM-dependent methyltransferase